MRRFFEWFFRSRETGAITIAQWPNLVLWIVIVAAVLLWFWPYAGKASIGLTIVVKAGLIIWGVDEILRGVNPWRRCLGAAVVLYVLITLMP
ncbi:hypothetical protein [Bradyrhizobium sp. CCGE-LA001]|uniref:hypothetical protein n=1 Tax=Bradyrhizobium sp. CCGE-LA001 TaxID=1223566 RepID=UPI0002AAACAC|nr:hypothetical protein [Bradyrhizobium sp. CCGE-LA001]AMA56934.1 glycine/betaine ABC transporter permease [Bradyrhizobium sp. CCGE-LA001]